MGMAETPAQKLKQECEQTIAAIEAHWRFEEVQRLAADGWQNTSTPNWVGRYRPKPKPHECSCPLHNPQPKATTMDNTKALTACELKQIIPLLDALSGIDCDDLEITAPVEIRREGKQVAILRPLDADFPLWCIDQELIG
jgi:hypothetical protein